MLKAQKPRRSGCPIGYALDIFGDRWTLLVLRDLLLAGKTSFRDLLHSDEGIASNILSDRLKVLENHGIIAKHSDQKDRRKFLYEVTEKGQSLLPVLLEIAAWGASHDPDTGAPPDFAPTYYESRDTFLKDPMSSLKKSGKAVKGGKE